jgi:hypothetical protein
MGAAEKTMRQLLLIGAAACGLLLAGCEEGYYGPGYGYGYDAGYGYGYYGPTDAWYDGYYGPYYDGYWNGGVFFFRDNAGHYQRDSGGHFRSQSFTGAQKVRASPQHGSPQRQQQRRRDQN